MVVRCTATSKNSKPCRSRAMDGHDLCSSHAGLTGRKPDPERVAKQHSARQVESDELLRRSPAASLADEQPVDFGAAARRLAPVSMIQVERALMGELRSAGGHSRSDWEARLRAAEIVLCPVCRAAST